MGATFPHLRQAEVTSVSRNLAGFAPKFELKGEDAMSARHFTSILATCAAVAAIALFAPALACGNGRCEAAAQTAESKPMKLRTFMRKPVASSATSTVKKKSSEPTKATAKRRAKQRTAAPQAAPEAISAGAAQAFAAYELARVRVVTPETTGSGMLAETMPVPPLNDNAADRANGVETGDTQASVQAGKVQAGNVQVGNVQAGSVQVVSAEDVNDIDRKADSPAAVAPSDSPAAISLDSLSRDLAGSAPKTEDGSWFQRMLLVLGGAFAAVVTLVKTVLG
jgi:hypothetical protein